MPYCDLDVDFGGRDSEALRNIARDLLSGVGYCYVCQQCGGFAQLEMGLLDAGATLQCEECGGLTDVLLVPHKGAER